jgi:beta-lactamase regulating signal transducer with metallopeptidase domain
MGALRTADAASALAGWATALRVVWMAGAATVLLRLLWGWLAIRETSVGARPVHDAGWGRRLDEARAALGLRRAVDLRRSPLLAAPLTWGTLHPVVLLPADADAWPEEHRRAVLLHELAHVRRLDCLVQVLGQLACAWWWFHPGVWWVAARLQAAREEACDARVLGAGVRAGDYAECLLQIAERARRDPSLGTVAVSVGMARPTSLATRMRAVLEPHRSDAEPSRLTSALVVAAGVALVVAVGMMRLVPLGP